MIRMKKRNYVLLFIIYFLMLNILYFSIPFFIVNYYTYDVCLIFLVMFNSAILLMLFLYALIVCFINKVLNDKRKKIIEIKLLQVEIIFTLITIMNIVVIALLYFTFYKYF